MIAIRAVAFLFFLAVAVGMVGWQVYHLAEDVASSPSPPVSLIAMAVGLGLVAAQVIAVRVMRGRDNFALLAVLGVLAWPVGGLLSLIQARGGNHRRIWEGVLTVGALAGVNIALPLLIGTKVIGGAVGGTAALIAIKVIFFVAVDYFLGRAILHYFASGASAFVSLRYLRRRILSLLSVFGIALGVFALINVNSVMQGFQRDFREQMRGSSSHLLVRIEADRVLNRVGDDELQQRNWATWVKRIEEDHAVAPAWQDALADAVRHWRANKDSDGDGLPDLGDIVNAQPVETPGDDREQSAEWSEAEKELVLRLRTGAGLTAFDKSCLRDNGEIVTPRQFYLPRAVNLATPEGQEQAAKITKTVQRDAVAPLFRAALHEQFERTQVVLERHTDPQGKPDVEGVSWRVNSKTMLTPRRQSRELNIAELVGVDVQREPEISNLGKYVADAELNMFREQYALGPLLMLLGATLGWEHPDTAPAQRKLFFQEDGRGVAQNFMPMSDYLAYHDLVRRNGKVRWSNFDSIRFLEFSPGEAMYERVKRAHKHASRTDDLDELGRIVRDCERDLRELLEPLAAIEEPADRFEAVNRTGARIILFEYMTSAGVSVDALQRQNNDVVGSLVTLSVELKDTLSSAEISFIGAVRDRLQRHTLAAQEICDDPASTEAAREQAILDQSNAFASEIETAIQQAQTAGHAATLERLQRIRGAMYEPESLLPMRMRLQARVPLPLRYAAENYDTGAQATQARMDAYRRVLPLRTSMQEDESVEEYIKRATTPGMRPERDMPGVILGDALAESALGTGVSVGDSISVMVPLIYMKEGRLTAETEEVWFRVTGFFRSGLYEENRARMYCDFEELTWLLTGSETQYTVGARVADYSVYEGQYRGDDLKRELRTALREAGVVSPYVSVWEDESRTLLEAVNTERTLIQLIVSFIILLTGGVIFILVYQLVNEKVKDIGILKALGYSPWGIRSVFMFNALFIGLFGALAGGLAGMFTSQYLNQVEDFIDQTTGYRLFPPEVYYLTYIPSIKGWELVELGMSIVVPVVLFSFLCGIYPALLAAKKDPVEALHYE